MYGAVWNRLPGPWPAKAIESLVLLTGVIALLFVVVFPWAEPRLPFSDVTVGDEELGDTVEPGAPLDPSAPGNAPGNAPGSPQLPGDPGAVTIPPDSIVGQ